MDEATARKWDRAAASFDMMNGVGPEKRWGPVKREFFARMKRELAFDPRADFATSARTSA